MIPSRISSPALFWGILVIVGVASYFARNLFADNGIWNSGIGFSIGLPTWVIFGLTVALLVFLGVLAYSHRTERLVVVGSAITCGGGLANLTDRIIHDGRVWDYLPFFQLGYFNVADIAVFVGLILLLWNWVSRPSNEH